MASAADVGHHRGRRRGGCCAVRCPGGGGRALPVRLCRERVHVARQARRLVRAGRHLPALGALVPVVTRPGATASLWHAAVGGGARLPAAMPTWAGVALGTMAYVIDKHGLSHPHPRLPRWCGLRMELHPLHELQCADAASHLLVSAAAAPPFIASRSLHGKPALDGGFADNAPRFPLSSRDPPQLMLLTRHYPKRPPLFTLEGRTYLQPSRRVPVSTWDCTQGTDINAAVALGRRDALDALRRNPIQPQPQPQSRGTQC